jgi:hypothetical protein
VSTQVFLAVNFYSGDRDLRLELVEVAGAAIAQCGLKDGSAEGAATGDLQGLPVADIVVPPTVYSAISAGLFEGGLRCEDPSVRTGATDSHAAEKRAFLEDLIAGDPATSGGRLAAWLTRVVDQVRFLRRGLMPQQRISSPPMQADRPAPLRSAPPRPIVGELFTLPILLR